MNSIQNGINKNNQKAPVVYSLQTISAVGNTTYTPTTTTYAEIILVGGGGSGGGSTISGKGGGGAAGGGIVYFNYELVANTSYTITVGARGTGVGDAAGNNGTATTFKLGATTIASATGGTKGSIATTSSGGPWAARAAAVSGSVHSSVTMDYTIYSGGYGGEAGNGVFSKSGGDVAITSDKLRNNATFINRYSGGGGGCLNELTAGPGSFGNGGPTSGASTASAVQTSYGSGGGGKKTGSTAGQGAPGVCFILPYTL